VLKGNESFVELHPGTAQSLGLKEGDRVVLKTPEGEATVRVHLFPGARPEAVYMPLGLGHRGYDAYIGGKGANVNPLLDVQGDPLSGQGIAWSARAQVKRLG
jgi:anaerobic selenocysteine-containing dehydrogenase